METYFPQYTDKQKDVVNHRFYIDDILKTLLEMKRDGYIYTTLSIDMDFEETHSVLSISAAECGGLGCVDYDGIDEVPIEEIEHYADRGALPPPFRGVLEGDFSKIDLD